MEFWCTQISATLILIPINAILEVDTTILVAVIAWEEENAPLMSAKTGSSEHSSLKIHAKQSVMIGAIAKVMPSVVRVQGGVTVSCIPREGSNIAPRMISP